LRRAASGRAKHTSVEVKQAHGMGARWMSGPSLSEYSSPHSAFLLYRADTVGYGGYPERNSDCACIPAKTGRRVVLRAGYRYFTCSPSAGTDPLQKGVNNVTSVVSVVSGGSCTRVLGFSLMAVQLCTLAVPSTTTGAATSARPLRVCGGCHTQQAVTHPRELTPRSRIADPACTADPAG